MKRKIFIVLITLLFFYSFDKWYFNRTSSLHVVKYNGSNLKVNIDGIASDKLPTNGNYYLVSYDCKSSDTKIRWNRATYQLDVSNGNKKATVSCSLNFQSSPKLSDMPVGSYVKYVGNNGCTGIECEGKNSNYIDDNDMGYCDNSNYKFISNGWRIAYSKDESAYLVSASSPECMCTDSFGNVKTTCSKNSNDDISRHVENLNRQALKYCNQEFAYNGACNRESAWNINDIDYQTIMKAKGNTKKLSNCNGVFGDLTCGYADDLIDIGSAYWYDATNLNLKFISWQPNIRGITSAYSYHSYGIRPVLRLNNSVVVLDGEGTIDEPYIIGNNSFNINGGERYVNKNEISNVKLNLIGNSNVSKMCVSVDSSGCSNYVDFDKNYLLDFSKISDGKKTIYVYYKDSSDNVIASMNRSVIVDTKAPLVHSLLIKNGDSLTRTIDISVSDASFMCFSNTSDDVSNCSKWVKYSNEYSWRLSAGVGSKVVYAFFKDKAGNVSNEKITTNVVSVTESIIDEDFSDIVYDNNLLISGEGSYPWVISDGRFQSNNRGINDSISVSKIQFSVSADAILSFDYGVLSENNYDKLFISLIENEKDMVLVKGISGVNTGKISNVSLSNGKDYTLILSYQKDSSASNNEDMAYIDNLKVQSQEEWNEK